MSPSTKSKTNTTRTQSQTRKHDTVTENESDAYFSKREMNLFTCRTAWRETSTG